MVDTAGYRAKAILGSRLVFPRKYPSEKPKVRVQRRQVNRAAILITLLIISVALSCGITGDAPSTPVPESASSSSEHQQGCGGVEGKVEEWERSEKRRLEEDVVIFRITMLQVSEGLEQIERDAEAMRQELLEECQAETKEPLLTDRDSRETESGQGRPLPTPTSTSTPRRASVVPTPTPVPTSTLKPTSSYTPTPTPAPPPATVLDEPPLIAAFAGVPASHNGREAIQFQLLFTEPVSTSYKILRDIAIQVENGSVKESKRVNKRNDLWMITVEPEGDEDMVITLTASAGCGHAASVCSEGGKALANSPTILVRHEQ